VAFAYASSAYIALWIFLHTQDKKSFWLLIPLFGALIDCIKQIVFLCKKQNETPWGLSKILIDNLILTYSSNFHDNSLLSSQFHPFKMDRFIPCYCFDLSLLGKTWRV